jgi:hypothetical protein
MITIDFSKVKSSSNLARLLHQSEILRVTPDGEVVVAPRDEIVFDLRSATWIDLHDIAFLAALSRTLAEKQTRVTIIAPSWEEKALTGRRRFFQRLGIHRVFRSLPEISRYLTFKGFSPSDPDEFQYALTDFGVPSLTSRYIPLTLVDRTWFDFHYENDEDDLPWLTLKRERVDHLEGLLLRNGYLDLRGTRVFVDTVFTEIAGNAVLHSDPHDTDAGWGVFCAHLKPREVGPGKWGQDLYLAFADLGVGIPSTLTHTYNKLAQEDVRSANTNRHSKILLFSLQQMGTRRQRIGSPLKEDQRGLTAVAEVAPSWGEVILRSSRGFVQLRGAEKTPSRKAEATPFPGVQMLICLGHRTIEQRVWSHHIPLNWTDDALIVQICDPRGGWRYGEPRGLLEQTLAENPQTRLVIFDCGFAIGRGRELDRWLRTAFEICGESILVFWNVAQEWGLLTEAGRWMQPRFRGNRRPILLVRDPHDIRVLGYRGYEADRLFYSETLGVDIVESTGDDYLRTGRLPAATYFAVDKIINSRFVELGFEMGGHPEGFFTGEINLMSGRRVKRFFALNRNVDDSPSNTRRWATSVASRLEEALLENPSPAGRTILLGLGYPLRRLLPVIATALAEIRNLDSYVLLPYDAPTSADIGSILGANDHVFLVTDVVSTGSFLDSVIEAVKLSGSRVVGIVAALELEVFGDTWDGIRYSSAGVFRPGAPVENAKRYWVDPVSMVPTDEEIWGERIDPRIEAAASLISTSLATRVGHCVEGIRHSTIHVSLRDILKDHMDDLLPNLREEILRRIPRTKPWTGFHPRAVLVPAGIGRLERVFEDRSQRIVTAFATTVAEMFDLVREVWPDLPEPIEVPRVFDPDGRPRIGIAREGLFAESIGGDVLILDDAIASGRTTMGLAQLGLRLGATRIAAITLLARMTVHDLTFWEQISEITNGKRVVPFVAVFPLILPSVYQTAAETPHEATRFKLRRWTTRSDVVGEVAREIADGLVGRSPVLVPPQEAQYVTTWVNATIWGNIASESQYAVQRLMTLLEELDFDDNWRRRKAFVDVFLEDWRLLRHPRLRQVLRPAIQDKIRKWVRSSEIPEEVHISLMALLRSLYPATFVSHLMQVADDPEVGGHVLARTIFHGITLRADLRRDERVERFARRVKEFQIPRLARIAHSAEELWQVSRIQLLAVELSLEAQRVVIPDTAAAAIIGLVQEHREWLLRHDVAKTLGNIAGALGRDPGTVGRETWEHYRSDWDRAQNTITLKILPLLERVRDLFVHATHYGIDISKADVDYLFSAENSETGRLRTDVGSLSGLLLVLAANVDPFVSQRVARTTVRRLFDYLLDQPSKPSVLIHALEIFTHTTLESMSKALRDEIEALQVPGAKLRFAEESDAIELRQNALITPGLWRTLAIGLADNLATKAFPREAEIREPAVLVKWSFEEHERHVIIEMFDNGRPSDRRFRVGGTLEKLNAFLAALGGSVDGCLPTDVHPWQNMTRIRVLLVPSTGDQL